MCVGFTNACSISLLPSLISFVLLFINGLSTEQDL